MENERLTSTKMSLLTRTINKFVYGIIDSVSEKKIPDGAASAALNFVTAGNRIELRRGYLRMGDDQNYGAELLTNGGFTGSATGWDLGIHTYYNDNNILLISGDFSTGSD